MLEVRLEKAHNNKLVSIVDEKENTKVQYIPENYNETNDNKEEIEESSKVNLTDTINKNDIVDFKDFNNLEKIYLLKKLKDINYDILRKYITEEEAIIISLKLGLGEKSFSTINIAKFFNKTENEVIEIVKKVLNVLKDIINKTIDDSREYLINNLEYKKLILENKTDNK